MFFVYLQRLSQLAWCGLYGSRHRWICFVWGYDAIHSYCWFLIAGIKGRFERYLLRANLANLFSIRRYRNEASTWVYYIPMFREHKSSRHNSYNTQWRGLAELLILIEGQCESLHVGWATKVSPTSFVSIALFILIAEAGRVVGKKEDSYEHFKSLHKYRSFAWYFKERSYLFMGNTL